MRYRLAQGPAQGLKKRFHHVVGIASVGNLGMKGNGSMVHQSLKKFFYELRVKILNFSPPKGKVINKAGSAREVHVHVGQDSPEKVHRGCAVVAQCFAGDEVLVARLLIRYRQNEKPAFALEDSA